jgi:lipid-A-disaccharide synthase
VAGEASADLHGSNLVRAVKALDPAVKFSGIGGEKMRRAGVKILFSAADMAVVGLTEVFGRLFTIFRASNKLKSILKNGHPHLLILIDYPDFNLHIAKAAKRFGIPVLYYISPQVWAWRSGRVKKIEKRIDRMAVILPFEVEFYHHRGVMSVEYVGHPVLDAYSAFVRDEGTQDFKMGDDGNPILGLLPGSRKDEIRNLLPIMIKTAENLKLRHPRMKCLLPIADTIESKFIKNYTNKVSVEINIVRGSTYKVLSQCDAAIVTSGTATLEAGIMGVPMVVVYKGSPISFYIARMLVKVEYISLVNLVAGKEVVCELIQNDVVTEKLTHEVQKILGDNNIRKKMIANLKKVKKKLGFEGASQKTAKIALEMME